MPPRVVAESPPAVLLVAAPVPRRGGAGDAHSGRGRAACAEASASAVARQRLGGRGLARAALAGERGVERGGHLGGVGVAQVDHADVAARAGTVERDDELAQGRQAAGRVGAHQQAVAVGLGDDLRRRQAARVLPAGLLLREQASQHGGEVVGHRVLQVQHGDVALRRVDGVDHRRQPAQVLGVVGDHQGVVSGERGDGVVGRDQRAHHVDHVRRRLVAQREDLGHQAVATCAPCALAVAHHRDAVQLGVGLGHQLGHARLLDRRVALQAQRREQDLVGQLGRHRGVGDEVDLALDARVDEEVAPRDAPDCLDHRVDLGVLEVERHRLACRERRWRAEAERGEDERGEGDRAQGAAQCIPAVRTAGAGRRSLGGEAGHR